MPERVSGRPVVRGTRLSPVEEMAENFGLEEDEIRAILAYAAAGPATELT